MSGKHTNKKLLEKIRHLEEENRQLKQNIARTGSEHSLHNKFDNIYSSISDVLSFTKGENFYKTLLAKLSERLGAEGCFIGKLSNDDSINTRALYLDNQFRRNKTYKLKGTPCEQVIFSDVCTFPKDVHLDFPNDKLLVDEKIEAYTGQPLMDSNGKPIGLLSLLFRRTIDESESQFIEAVLKVFAIRAALELEKEEIISKLNTSEEKFLNLFSTDPDLIFYINLERETFIDVNEMFVEKTGFTSEEIKDVKLSDHPSIPFKEQINKLLNQLNNEANITDEKFDIADRNGHRSTFLISAKPIKLGGSNCAVIIAKDLTDLLNIKKELDRREAHYKSIIDNLPDIILQLNLQGEFLYINKVASEYFDKKLYDLKGRTLEQSGFGNDVIRIFSEQFKKVITYGTFRENEFDIKKDTNVYYINWLYMPEFDNEGNLDSIMIIGRDKTRQKRTRLEYQTLFQQLPSAFALHEIITDNRDNPIDYRFLSVNPAFEETTGLNADEVLGKTVKEIIPEVDDELIKKYGKVALTGVPDSFRLHFKPFNRDYQITVYSPYRRQFVTLFSDISKIVKAEQALKESEEKYRRLFNAESEAVIIFDYETLKFADANKATFELFGYTREEFEKMKLPDISAEKEKTKAAIERVKDGELMKIPQRLMKKKDGSIFPVEVNTRTYTWGNKRMIFGVIRDITERLKLEKERLKNLERIQLYGNVVNSIFVVLDKHGTIQMINDKGAEITGYEKEELVGKNIFDTFVPGENKEELKRYFNQIYTSDSDFPPYNENYFVARDGSRKLIGWHNSRVTDSQGNVTAIISSGEDITEKRFIEAEMNKLSRSVEQSPVMTVITDSSGLIEYVNPRFTEITGYSLDEVKGKTPRVLKSGKMQQKIYEELWRTIKAGDDWFGELLNRKKSGEVYWTSQSISPVLNDKQEITHFLSLSEDITKRKQIEHELIAAKQKAEESDRLKTSILSNMNHELRTPMQGIMGFASVLHKSLKDKQYTKLTDNLLQSSRRLMNTLNSILLLSSLYSESEDVEKSTFYLDPDLREVFRIHKKEAERKGLGFSLNFEDENLQIYGYKDTILPLFSNLIDNAVKYTNRGRVEITVSKQVREEENFAVVEIEDTGIGITEKDKGLIFQEFRQASEGWGRSFEGTGLGLAIVKKLIDMHGGKIEVESEQNKGSCFTVSLPIAHQEHGKQQEEKEISLFGKQRTKTVSNKNSPKILIVEDNDLNTELLISYLKRDYEIECVKNGSEAIELTDKREFDLILMDINLGVGIDGAETLKIIRENEKNKDIPVVATTGYSTGKDKERLRQGGFDLILSKPFSRRQLLNAINEIILQ